MPPSRPRRERLQPALSPAPRIDHLHYPHIIDSIFRYASRPSLLVMRNVARRGELERTGI